MFKETEKTNKELIKTNRVIQQLGKITQDQQREFSAITGRFDSTFKIAKQSSSVIGKSVL